MSLIALPERHTLLTFVLESIHVCLSNELVLPWALVSKRPARLSFAMKTRSFSMEKKTLVTLQ